MSMRGLCLTGLAALSSMLIAGSFSVVAAADAEGCPNEALRTELDSGSLPDCRAYEMVSPPLRRAILFWCGAIRRMEIKLFSIALET